MKISKSDDTQTVLISEMELMSNGTPASQQNNIRCDKEPRAFPGFEEQSESQQCTQCEENSPRWLCKECNIVLCDKCQRGHLRIPICHDHKAISMYIESSEPTQNGDELSYRYNLDHICKFHLEVLQLNCLTCDRIICIKCQANDHTEHEVEYLGKSCDKLLDTFQATSERIQDSLYPLAEKLNIIDHNIAKINNIFQECKGKMEDRASEMIEIINDDKGSLIRLLSLKQAEELGKLEKLKGKILHEMKTSESLKEKLNRKERDLVSNLDKYLKCESEITDPQTLSLTKVTVLGPKFVPHISDSNKQQQQQNKIGKLEFTEYQIKLTPPKITSGLGIPEKLSQEMKINYEIIIPTGSSFHFSIVNTDLWVPVHGEDLILVYTANGERKKVLTLSKSTDIAWGIKSSGTWKQNVVKKVDSISAPRAVCQFTSNVVLVASDSGIYEMTTEGDVKGQLMAGQFCDVSMQESQGRFGTIDYGSKKCVLFSLDNYGRWQKEREFVVKKCKVDHYASIILLQDSVIICPGGSHVLQKYNLDGESMYEYGCYGRGEPGQLWGPSLCSVDQYGNILVADVNNKRLQVLDRSDKWLVTYVKDMTYPFDVEIVDTGLWALIHHKNAKYKLVHYTFTSARSNNKTF